MDYLDFSVVRWVKDSSADALKQFENSRCMLVFDHFMRPLLLFANQYTLNTFMDRNENIKLVEALDIESELN